MPLALFFTGVIIYCSWQIIAMWTPKKESKYSNGAKPTKSQQKIIDKQMHDLVEKIPNSPVWEKLPEHKQRYLNKIDLSELNEALGKKN